MIYGIRNRGNTCYAAAILQCLSRILECIPTEITDLDSIPTRMSDAQEYYERLIAKMPIAKRMMSATLSSGISVPCLLSSQMDNVTDTGPAISIRVTLTSTIQDVRLTYVNGIQYRLVAAVCFSNRHYTAIVEDQESWYLCDDSDLQRIGVDSLLYLYLLFYKYVPDPNVTVPSLHSTTSREEEGRMQVRRGLRTRLR